MKKQQNIPSQQFAPWDYQQDDELWRLKKLHLSFKDIALKMGRSELSIKQRLNILRQIRRDRERRHHVETPSIAPIVSHHCKSNLRRHKSRWSKSEDIKLRKFKDEGKTNREIGDILGRTSDAVCNRWGFLQKQSSELCAIAPFKVQSFSAEEKEEHDLLAHHAWCCSCDNLSLEYDDIILCDQCQCIWAHQKCMGVTSEQLDDDSYIHRCYVCIGQSERGEVHRMNIDTVFEPTDDSSTDNRQNPMRNCQSSNNREEDNRCKSIFI